MPFPRFLFLTPPPPVPQSLKTQTYQVTQDGDGESSAVITETNTIRGIPYADYFNVKIRWEVRCPRDVPSPEAKEQDRLLDPPSSSCSSGGQVSITIWLDFDFFKYTWLQGTIESNTQAELLGVYEQWVASAEEYLQSRSHLALSVETDAGAGAEEEKSEAGGAGAGATASRDGRSGSVSLGALRSQPSSLSSAVAMDEEETVFYDCSEGSEEPRDYTLHRSLSGRGGFASSGSLAGLGLGGGGGTRRSTLDLHSAASLRSFYSSDHAADSPRSTRDVVVTIVETVFVVAEASFWRVHTIYRTDVKVLFSVTPEAILQRVVNTVRPGCHSAALVQPDFYGPVLAVFLLPQILLLSMDVSQYGCNQTSMLGNATVVTLSLWVGLSILYRLLSFVIAPGIYFKHCLCITGYSFYAWSLALLCSYPVEKYKATLGLPVALPLVLFGIPAALAQGFVFWEHTPYASAGMQQALFPSSLQHFAQQHSRWLQKLLWAVPKVAALIVVAGTHYQLLWYLARVFLPGRKRLCNLSFLMDRGQASDILSQKEIRKYALMLLKGGHDD